VCWVVSSNSDAKDAKLSTSRYWAKDNLRVPAICFKAFTCAAEPTRETLNPTLIAGLMPWLNNSLSKKTCPSVIEITSIFYKKKFTFLSTFLLFYFILSLIIYI
jgi:hypothetical protein